MELFNKLMSRGWRPVLMALGVAIAVWFLFFYHITGPTRLASQEEHNLIAHTFGLKDLLNSPVNLPLRFTQTTASHIFGKTLLVYRLVNALLGIIIGACFYFLLRQLFTVRMAFFGTLLAISSPWFLNASHLATSSITFGLIVVPLAMLEWLKAGSNRAVWAWLGLCTSAALILYVPGMVLLAGPAIAVLIRRKDKLLGPVPTSLIILGPILFIGLCVPLVAGVVHSQTSLLAILGLPKHWPKLASLPRDIVSAPVQLVFRSRLSPAEHLGHLPLLDIFTSFMAAVGGYLLLLERRLDRYKYIVGSGVVFTVLYGLGGPISLLALWPAAFLLATGGISLMLGQWFTVFPRNPVARKVGVALLATVVMFAVSYNLLNYFVAWPHTPATISAFQQKKP